MARALAVLAVLWAVAAAIHIWRTPLTGREIRAVTDTLGPPLREVVVTSRPFGEAAGGLAVGFLIGFVVVNALGAWAVWRRQPVTATAVAVAGLLLCLVTGFSIGRAFWTAAWCLLGAALISWVAREADPIAAAAHQKTRVGVDAAAGTDCLEEES